MKKGFISPLFFIFFIYFFISKQLDEFFSFFIALLIHEFGHYFVAKKLGYKLNKFYLTPCGAELNYEGNDFLFHDEIIISLAGPICNLIICIVLTTIWWVCPFIYNFTNLLAFNNFILALINLLPAFPLDGGRVATKIFEDKFSIKKVNKILFFLNIFLSMLFFCLFIISCFSNFNPTLLLMSVFILSGIFQRGTKISYKNFYLVSGKKNNLGKINFIYVECQTSLKKALNKIKRNKFNLYYIQFFGKQKNKILEEDNLIKLSLKYPLDTNFNEIFDKE